VRLDHLLSKEHHETQAGPHRAEHRELGDSVDGLFSVVEAGLVHKVVQNKRRCPVGKHIGAEKLSDTLLGFETTGPRTGLVGGRCRLLRVSLQCVGDRMGFWLSPCFGGGVWCLICG
jgi:hypothetical protein